MDGLFILIFTLLVLLYILTWILSKLLAWFVQHKYNIVYKIGSIKIPQLKICDIVVSKEEVVFSMSEISIGSSFFNSDLTKLCTFVIKDLHIDLHGNKDYRSLKQPLNFQNLITAYYIRTFAQFVALHIYNVSAILLHFKNPYWELHATADEIHFDGSMFHNEGTLLLTATLVDACVKALRPSKDQEFEETWYAGIRFSLLLEATLVAQEPLSIEKILITSSQTSSVINDSFYNLVYYKSRSSKNLSIFGINAGNDLYTRLFPVIPKSFTLAMENIIVQDVSDDLQSEFVVSLKTLIFTCRFNAPDIDTLTSVNYAVELEDLRISDNDEELFFVKESFINVKLQGILANLYLKLDSSLVNYNHNIIHKWFQSNYLPNKTKLSPLTISYCDSSTSIGKLEHFAKKYVINAHAEFYKVCILVDFNNNRSWIGFNHVSFGLLQDLSKRETEFTSLLPKILLADRHFNVKILIESIWWSLREQKQKSDINKKTHVWGTPLFLGMALFKFGSHDAKETRIESVLVGLRVEWSPKLASYILIAIRCFKDYRDIKVQKNRPLQCMLETANLNISMSLTNFNLFVVGQNGGRIVARLNSLSLDRNVQIASAQFKGFKVFTAKDKSSYNCTQCENIQQYNVFIKLAQFEIATSSIAVIHLLEEVNVKWSTTFHLKMLGIVRECQNFLVSVNESLTYNFQEQMNACVALWKLRISGIFVFDLITSEKHATKVSLGNTTIFYAKSRLSMSSNTIITSIDNSDIFTIKCAKFSHIKDIVKELTNTEAFIVPQNKTWRLSMDLLKVAFLPKHNYVDVIRKELTSIWNCLFGMVVFTDNNLLPSSMTINIKEYLCEVINDPIHVRPRKKLLRIKYKKNHK